METIMLKSSEAALLLNRLDTSVRRLTTYKGNLPDTNSSQETIAGELFLVDELHKRTAARLKAVREAAVLEGVTFDTNESTLKGKDSKLLYNGEHIMVTVNVSEASVKYPHQKIRAELMKLKIPPKDIEKVFKNSMVKNRYPHAFHANLKTEEIMKSMPEQVEVTIIDTTSK
jgi:hypothetical protein